MNASAPLLECFTVELTDINNVHTKKSPHAKTLDPRLQPLGRLLESALCLPADRRCFYDLLEKVKSSTNKSANEEWGLNYDSYIIDKKNITIKQNFPEFPEKKIIVSIPLFLQAMKEWEEYLSENFPKFADNS